jgi:hypothetical protein
VGEKLPVTHWLNPFFSAKNKIGKAKNEQSEVFRSSLQFTEQE